ncbi:MAG: fatty acid desaturase [Bacteroidia bacterium]|nr:fatty acid desaturase [Bacteroidia bacterium]
MEKIVKQWTSHPMTGTRIGIGIILLWAITLVFNLIVPINWYNPFTYLMVFVQAHLFTGLFITAHDAMHGAVAPKKPKLNHAIGKVASFLFVFNSYKKLKPKHYEHHKHAGTEHDPDFHNGNPNFFLWYFDFLKEYISIKQILLAAITFNVGKLLLHIPQENLILFWIIPSFMGTFQLFYFGTFIPHMGEHNNRHNARSQSKNHLWAFLSCYFFGYHYEHHDSPMTPWWKLWELK